MNSLVNGGIFANKVQAVEVFEKLGYDANIRGENLTINDFARLSDEIIKFKK